MVLQQIRASQERLLEEAKKDDSTKEANPIETSSSMVDEVLSVCNISQYHQEWLLDSRALHHIFPHRSWFSSYQAIDLRIVLMGNNVSCKIVENGSIRAWAC